ncbi:MAG: M67 family metallopeptidase [Planctomycetota bacterium]
MRYFFPSATANPFRLVVDPEHKETLAAAARAAYPHEGCGVLIGRRSLGVSHVERITISRNLEESRARDRYILNPVDLLAAEESAAAEGLDVLGIWHTHPDHPALPSETDQAGAWPNWSYVILSIHRGELADFRSWQLVDGTFVEEEVAEL